MEENIVELMQAKAKEIESEPVPQGQLDGLQKLAEKACKLEDLMAELDATLKTAKEQYVRIVEDQIPATLKAVKMKKFTMDDGSEVAMAQQIFTKIKEDNKKTAFNWLREIKCGDIIDSQLVFTFDVGEEHLAKKVFEIAEQDPELKEIQHEYAESVHAARLKSFVKERLEKNLPLDLTLFGVHQRDIAEITRPQKPKKK